MRISSGNASTSYVSSGLSASTTYYFLVTAVNSNGESSPANIASATTQAANQTSSCHVTYTLNSEWNVGFNVSIGIQNTGTTPISSWTLTWNWAPNESVSQAWNSNLISGRAQRGAGERQLERLHPIGRNNLGRRI